MEITKLDLIQKLAEENPLEFYLYIERNPQLLFDPDIYSIEVEYNTRARIHELYGIEINSSPNYLNSWLM